MSSKLLEALKEAPGNLMSRWHLMTHHGITEQELADAEKAGHISTLKGDKENNSSYHSVVLTIDGLTYLGMM